MRTIRPLILIIAVFGTAIMRAQSPLPVSAVAASRSDAVADNDTRSVRLLVGRSTVVDVDVADLARVADQLRRRRCRSSHRRTSCSSTARCPAPSRCSCGIASGAHPPLRSGRAARPRPARRAGPAAVSRRRRSMSQSNGSDIVLSGIVSNKDVIEKAINVAAGYVDKRDEVVTLLQVRDSGASNQVLLRVRFAEVSRSAMTDLGLQHVHRPERLQGRSRTRRHGSSRRADLRQRGSRPAASSSSATSSTCSSSTPSTSSAR